MENWCLRKHRSGRLDLSDNGNPRLIHPMWLNNPCNASDQLLSSFKSTLTFSIPSLINRRFGPAFSARVYWASASLYLPIATNQSA